MQESLDQDDEAILLAFERAVALGTLVDHVETPGALVELFLARLSYESRKSADEDQRA